MESIHDSLYDRYIQTNKQREKSVHEICIRKQILGVFDFNVFNIFFFSTKFFKNNDNTELQ